MKVTVVEGTANELNVRAGYATLDCIRLQLRASRAAMFGTPGRVELTMNLSKVAVGSRSTSRRGSARAMCARTRTAVASTTTSVGHMRSRR